MKFIKQCVVICLSLGFLSVAFAAQSPKFNKDNKMKANEVFKKCADWAQKETASMKEATPADKTKKRDEYLKLANSCSLNNGFDAKGK